MLLATYTVSGRRHVGVVSEDRTTVSPLAVSDAAAALGVRAIVEDAAAGRHLPEAGAPVPLAEVTLDAPIPRPARNIFCVGKNYFDHAHEFAKSGFDMSAASGAVPEAPIIFSKVPESVIGPDRPILIDPDISTAIDYEAELAVIIGTGGRGIPKERALEHIFGYTIVNDVTARDIQGRHKQWLLGKSQDTFCPMGPWVVTADAVSLDDMVVRCWVNDELRQDAPTKALIFDVPTLISTISRGITLQPGDIIATGTPAGVGIGFDPPRYLRDGDRVRIEISGIGNLGNVVARYGRRP
ncbi:Fumarylacetoacetate hydrolase family protein [Caenispirillum salinarum AK4]|uniref:Fumarylacetoacetate hydrolase family protein n=2 Tax=Caenispirillum TaxID=414051 RepID=K9H5M9_9PROT|nr:Fumarylacetoacetate hydrolase family protein [Caenispirillum salinarum AK4]